MKKAYKKAVFRIQGNSCAFCLFISFFLNIAVEALSRQSVLGAVASIFKSPFVFLTNMLIIAFTLSLGNFMKKRDFTYLIISIIWLGLGIADFILLFFRVTPLCGGDFMILKAAVSIVGLYLSVYHIAGIAVLFGTAVLLAVLVYMKEKNKIPDIKSSALFSVITGAVIMTVSCTGALKPDFSDLMTAYRKYGFAYSFLSTVFDKGIDEPMDYSEKRFSDAIRTINDEPLNDAVVKPDIIFVQLESFFDVNYLKNMSFSEDPVPNFTRLKSEYSHGFLRVPVVGGGTANTEFEVLTGINLKFFGAGEYPFETVLRKNTCESIAYDLKEYGYSTHAIHNHTGDFYCRNDVYPNLGFDTFTSAEYMNGIKKNQMNWANDSLLTGYITEALDSTEGKDFVYAVSVQAHGNYPKIRVPGSYPIHAGGAESVEDMYRYIYYVNQLFETDKFIGELTEALERRNTPTIAVFYGDHLPALKIGNEDLENGDIYTTEYIIWDNIGFEKQEADICAYQLFSYVLEKVGMNSGVMNKLHRYYKENPEYEKFSEILAYDVFNGEHKDYLKYYEPTDMKMGLEPIKITGTALKGASFKVYGSGFTESSVIMIDNKEVKTFFIDENTIVTYDTSQIKEDCHIKVGQFTPNGKKLSETLPFFNIKH